MHGQTHAEWLEKAVYMYASLGWPVIVSCTDYHGILSVNTSEGDHERGVLWRLIDRGFPIMGESINPGHQVGAALCIRIGLEYAAYCGYDYLIHTAEDVMPEFSVLDRMVKALDEGAHYCGEKWGLDMTELNSQFFACRVRPLVNIWDACAVSGHGCIERYLRACVGDHPKVYFDGEDGKGGRCYRTCHDFELWKRWKREEEQKSVQKT